MKQGIVGLLVEVMVVQGVRLGVMFGSVEKLRPGETTMGIPEEKTRGRMVVRKKVKVVIVLAMFL